MGPLSMSIDKTRPGVGPRARLVISGCLTALAAALFTVVFFDVLTPPDPAALLNPPPAARPTAVRPTKDTIPPIPKLFLDDNFNSRQYWPAGGDNASYGYQQNGYWLAPSLNPDFTHVLLKELPKTTGRDLSIEAEASPLPGSTAVEYGVLFWHSRDKEGHERFLYFAVNTEGMYTLRASVPVTATTASPAVERWVDLVPRTSSSTIKKNGESNRLRVDVHPHRIIAFINSQLVLDRDNPDIDAFRDRQDFDGGVGLIALALGSRNQKALFSQFSLYLDVKSQ